MISLDILSFRTAGFLLPGWVRAVLGTCLLSFLCLSCAGSPASGPSPGALAGMPADVGTGREAVALYTETLRKNQDDYLAYYNRAMAWASLGDYGPATEDLDKSIGINPRNAAAYANRGTVWGKRGFHAESLKDFSQALAMNPEMPEVYFNRGITWGYLENWKRAAQNLDRALALRPGYAKALLFRGRIRLMQEHPEQALQDLDAACRLDPDEARNFMYRGLAFMALEQMEGRGTRYDPVFGIGSAKRQVLFPPWRSPPGPGQDSPGPGRFEPCRGPESLFRENLLCAGAAQL